MSEPAVRVALDHELQAVGRLTLAAYRAGGHLGEGDSEETGYADWLANAGGRARQGTVVVALVYGAVAGSVLWCPPGSGARELAADTDQGEFRALAVDPAFQGYGAGRALVAHCIAEARRLRLRELLLSSLPTMTAAHGLYVSCGFSRRPDLDWAPRPGIDLLAYGLRLAPPPPPENR